MAKDKKCLVLYFSRADENYSVGYVTKGNTEYLAEFICAELGCDSFKVERLEPYAKDYNTCIKEAQAEKRANAKVELKQSLSDISGYDVIFIGSPVYWGGLPQPLIEQIKMLNFNGKDVYTFVTHEGSGDSGVVREVKAYCSGANIKGEFNCYGSEAQKSKNAIINWLNGLF